MRFNIPPATSPNVRFATLPATYLQRLWRKERDVWRGARDEAIRNSNVPLSAMSDRLTFGRIRQSNDEDEDFRLTGTLYFEPGGIFLDWKCRFWYRVAWTMSR